MNLIERRRYAAALRTWTVAELADELAAVQANYLHTAADCEQCAVIYQRRAVIEQELFRREHDKAREV